MIYRPELHQGIGVLAKDEDIVPFDQLVADAAQDQAVCERVVPVR